VPIGTRDARSDRHRHCVVLPGPGACDVPYSAPDKESNRETARLTDAKLSSIGYRIVRTAAGKAAPTVASLPQEQAEELMRLEHDLWPREHLLSGYEWAEKTQEALRLHRDIVSYDELTAPERALDASPIKDILENLLRYGYVLVNNQPSAELSRRICSPVRVAPMRAKANGGPSGLSRARPIPGVAARGIGRPFSARRPNATDTHLTGWIGIYRLGALAAQVGAGVVAVAGARVGPDGAARNNFHFA
jgi:RyR domain